MGGRKTWGFLFEGFKGLRVLQRVKGSLRGANNIKILALIMNGKTPNYIFATLVLAGNVLLSIHQTFRGQLYNLITQTASVVPVHTPQQSIFCNFKAN